MALVAAAAISLAVKTPAKAPLCPDPTQVCGAPPVAVSFEPIAGSSPSASPTPRPTIVRPLGTVPPVAPSAEPTAALDIPFAIPLAIPIPFALAVTIAIAQRVDRLDGDPRTSSVVPILGLPSPSPASSAEPLQAGQVWTSSRYGFSLEYADGLWTVEQQDTTSIILSAGNGALVVYVEGFDARDGEPQQLVQSGVDGLQDVVLGLTEENDPDRQLPGRPIVGYLPGEGAVLNGTLNSPQGPTADVTVVVLASTDDTISIRATILVDQRVRDRGFSVADGLLNSITWPVAPP